MVEAVGKENPIFSQLLAAATIGLTLDLVYRANFLKFIF
jgi:hypothetical protein